MPRRPAVGVYARCRRAGDRRRRGGRSRCSAATGSVNAVGAWFQLPSATSSVLPCRGVPAIAAAPSRRVALAPATRPTSARTPSPCRSRRWHGRRSRASGRRPSRLRVGRLRRAVDRLAVRAGGVAAVPLVRVADRARARPRCPASRSAACPAGRPGHRRRRGARRARARPRSAGVAALSASCVAAPTRRVDDGEQRVPDVGGGRPRRCRRRAGDRRCRAGRSRCSAATGTDAVGVGVQPPAETWSVWPSSARR